MARRSASRKPPAGWPTWSSDRTFATTAGSIIGIPENLWRWVARWQNAISTKSKPWRQKLNLMSLHTLTHLWQELPESMVRRLQAAKLNRYLRATVLPFSAHYRNL